MLTLLTNFQYCLDVLTSTIAPEILIYSHVPIAIVSFIGGLYIFIRSKNISGYYLFLLTTSFAIWSVLDLFNWFVFLGSEYTMFSWSLIDIFSQLFFLLSLLFIVSFHTGKNINKLTKLLSIAVMCPVIIYTYLGKNISSFAYDICEANESSFVSIYNTIFYIVIILTIIIFTILYNSKNKKNIRKNYLASAGILIFLVIFSLSTFLTNLNIYLELWNINSYTISVYGLFGMPILISFLAYLIIRYKAFEIKLFAAQILVSVIAVFVATQYIFIHENVAYILTTITFLLTTIFGYFLIRSVQKEIEQREEIEKLALNLERSNAELSHLIDEKNEFIALATHQLRAPLGAIQGYASLVLEGDYGKITPETAEAVSIMYTSAHNLTGIVGDYLDFSRLDLNSLEIHSSPVDVIDAISAIVREQQPILRIHETTLNWDPQKIPKALLTKQQSDTPQSQSVALVNADIGKLKQIISNLIDNAIKYTEKGTITISISRASKLDGAHTVDAANHVAEDQAPGKGYRITVADNGIGMTPATISKLFKRFSRAERAHETNIMGTGLGLYLAKHMVERMNGKIWAESDGPNKGSRFIVELPAP